MRRSEPPERPVPQCLICGSYEVIREAVENGAPLCEEHDHPVRRKRLFLEEGISQASEAVGHISMKRSREAGGNEAERLDRLLERERERLSRRYEKLDELQAECDHTETEEQTERGRGPDGHLVEARMEVCTICGKAEWGGL